MCVYGVENLSATVIVRAGGAIRLSPFATVLFSVCSAMTVECCVPVLHECVCCYVGKKALLQCLQLLRGGIWACVRYPCLRWVLDREYVSQLTCVRYYVFVKSSFKHTREECESKRAYVF